MQLSVSVTSSIILRDLCINNNWFTCGSCEQYDKLFYANENGATIAEIATIIWLCSDDNIRRSDILFELKKERKRYLKNLNSDWQ